MKRRILNLLIVLDQFLFCLITLGGSSPDETLSAAAYRWEQGRKRYAWVLRRAIDGLFFFDPDHCRTSYESELNKAHLPSEYRAG